jgi:N-acetylglucosamine-6-phosphate deacetylase
MILDAFRTAVRALGTSLQRAVDMCSSTPAAVAGLTHIGSIQVGKRADLVLLNSNLEVEKVLVNGTVVHDAKA